MENVELEVSENEGDTNFDVGIEDDSDMVLGGESTEQTIDFNYGSSQHVYNPQVSAELMPRKGKEFATLDDVQNFYNSYAKEAGFSIRNWSTRKSRLGNEILRKEYVCSKQGKGSIISDIEAKRRRGSIKEDCKAKIAVVKSKAGSFVSLRGTVTH